MDSEEIENLLTKTKRACRMCRTYKRTSFDRGEKDKAISGLNELIQLFEKQFSELRKDESVSGEIAQDALENKRLCMDLLDECAACEKETERITSGLTRIKK